MTTYSFFVMMAVCLVILPSIVLYLSRLKRVQYVKAGKVDDFCPSFCFMTCSADKVRYKDGDAIVNPSGYEMYKVHGNSMRDYGVMSNQVILVQPLLNEEDKKTIKTHPVLMLHIDKASKIQSQYKLRKFIAYVEPESCDWDEVYKANEDRVNKVSENTFVESMKRKQAKESIKGQAVLSATYNEHGGMYEYSLHPVSAIYGIVKYAM